MKLEIQLIGADFCTDGYLKSFIVPKRYPANLAGESKEIFLCQWAKKIFISKLIWDKHVGFYVQSEYGMIMFNELTEMHLIERN